ncbi:MAG: hypothetical protein IT373_35990, partial [Polyangiaceae bacterium]|nr:hypothetical protein [Polyangiaceae bacterium]
MQSFRSLASRRDPWLAFVGLWVGLLSAAPAWAGEPPTPPGAEPEPAAPPIPPAPEPRGSHATDPGGARAGEEPAKVATDAGTEGEGPKGAEAGEAEATEAATDDAEAPAPEGAVLGAGAEDRAFRDTFLVDAGRITEPTAVVDDVTFALHGEYQLRYRAFRDLALTPPLSDGSIDRLGQRHYLYHWARLKAEVKYEDVFKAVGEIDVPRGMVIGEKTQWVTA